MQKIVIDYKTVNDFCLELSFFRIGLMQIIACQISPYNELKIERFELLLTIPTVEKESFKRDKP